MTQAVNQTMTQAQEIMPFGNPPMELVQDSKMLWIYAVANLIVAIGLTIWIMGRQKGPGEKQLGVMALIDLYLVYRFRKAKWL